MFRSPCSRRKTGKRPSASSRWPEPDRSDKSVSIRVAFLNVTASAKSGHPIIASSPSARKVPTGNSLSARTPKDNGGAIGIWLQPETSQRSGRASPRSTARQATQRYRCRHMSHRRVPPPPPLTRPSPSDFLSMDWIDLRCQRQFQARAEIYSPNCLLARMRQN